MGPKLLTLSINSGYYKSFLWYSLSAFTNDHSFEWSFSDETNSILQKSSETKADKYYQEGI